MSKISPKAADDDKLEVKVAVTSRRKTALKPLSSISKIWCILFQVENNVAYQRGNDSLVLHGSFLVLSTGILFAYLLREYFALKFKTKWELGFILVSAFCYAPLGVLLFLAEAMLPGNSFSRLHNTLSVVFQFLWVLGINVCMGFALYMMIHTDQCMLSDPRHVNCDFQSVNKIPGSLMLTMLATPQVLSLFVPYLRSDVLFLSWLCNAGIILACIIEFNALNSLVPYVVAVPVSFYALYVAQKQKIELLAANLKLAADSTKTDNAAMQGNELRHLIGNVAHDLKTPLSSLNMGIDVIIGTLEEMTEYSTKHYHSMDSACKTSIDSFVQSLNETITNMKNVNVFMLMTINRCMDYTKATTGVKLVPKIETIDLAETIGLPVAIMNDMQDKRTIIRLLPIPPEVCTFIMTDKQWLQENVLCLLSNAMKYSSKGVVTISVSITNHGNDGTATPPPPETGMQRAISNLKSRPNSRPNSRVSSSENLVGLVQTVDGKQLKQGEEEVAQKQQQTSTKAEAKYAVRSSDISAVAEEASADPWDVMTPPTGSLRGSRSVCIDDGENSANKTAAQQCLNTSGSIDFTPVRSASKSTKDNKEMLRNNGTTSHTRPTQPMSFAATLSRKRMQSAKNQGSMKSQSLRVEIEDTGIGLSEEAMSNLFSPFNQAQRLAGGTGLGLFSLSKRVDALQGTYGVMKRRDGAQGSLFWFEIPYRPDMERRRDSFYELSVVIRNNNSNNNSNSHSNNVHNGPLVPEAAQHSHHEISSGSRNPPSVSRHSGIRLTNSSHRLSQTTQRQYEIKRSPSHRNSSPVVNDITSIHNNITRRRSCSTNTPPSSVRISSNISHSSESSSHVRSVRQAAAAAAGSKRICSTILSKAVLDKKSLNILLADDSVSIQKMTRMLLTKQGHKVTIAENGADALELIEAGYKTQLERAKQQQEKLMSQSGKDLHTAVQESRTGLGVAPFDVVLIDFQMPIMDGLEATRRVRALETELLQKYHAAVGPDVHGGFYSLTRSNTVSCGSGLNESGMVGSDGEPCKEDEFGELRGGSGGGNSSSNRGEPSPLPPPVFELQLYHQFIIGLSANSDDETLQIALDTGVDQFMPKPFTVANFQEMVDIYTLYYKYEDSGMQDDGSTTVGGDDTTHIQTPVKNN